MACNDTITERIARRQGGPTQYGHKHGATKRAWRVTVACAKPSENVCLTYAGCHGIVGNVHCATIERVNRLPPPPHLSPAILRWLFAGAQRRGSRRVCVSRVCDPPMEFSHD